jgi:hypothetical protein
LELDTLPAEVVRGEVVEVARRDTSTAHLEGNTDAPLERLTAGMFPAGRQTTRYHVRVAFDAPETALVTGSRGTAKIATEPMTLGRRAVRWLAQTFRLPYTKWLDQSPASDVGYHLGFVSCFGRATTRGLVQ